METLSARVQSRPEVISDGEGEGEGGAAAADGVSSLVAPLMKGTPPAGDGTSSDLGGISSDLASLVDAPADELEVTCNLIEPCNPT